jgi:hypothetical protein
MSQYYITVTLFARHNTSDQRSLAEIAGKPNPARRHRTCPRTVKRARHNSYRVKKPDEPASIRHDGPATIHIYKLQPRAA